MGITGGLQAEAYDRTYGDAQLLRRIGAYFRPHAGTVALVALTVALGSLAATILPLVISRGINALTGNPTAQTMLGLAGLVTVLGALGWLFNFIRQWLGARAVGDVVLALRQDAMAAVLRRDMSFFDQYASGRIVSRVSSDTQDFATVITLTIDLLSQLVLVGVIAAVMLVVNWRLALLTLASGPIVLVVALVFRRIARRAMRQSQRAQAEVNAIVQETISGVAVAKSFRQEAAIFADFEATNNMAYRIQLLRVAVFGSIYPLMNTLSGMGIAIVVYAGGRLVLDHTVSIGDWYLFVQSLTIFFYPITSISSFWSQFQQGLAASERVFALIDAEPRVVQLAQEPVEQLAGRITFEQVGFSYDQGDGGQGIGDGENSAAGSSQPPTPIPHPLAVGAANRDHPHAVAVLFAKQRHRAALQRILVVGHFPHHRRIGAHPGVDPALDLALLIGCDLAIVGEVEAQSLGRYQRASLRRMLAQHVAQRAVQQVRCRVVARNVAPPLGINTRLQRLVQRHYALLHNAKMNDHAWHRPLSIFDPHATGGADQPAGIANLTATLGVEWRTIQHDLHRLARTHAADRVATAD